MMMKKAILMIVLVLAVLSVNAAETVDFIVAKVGREIILFSDLIRQINQMRSARVWNEDMTPDVVLESMVENKLIVQKARELNIRVDERRINNAVENQLNQVRASFGSEEEFHRELRNSGLLLSDLRRFYEESMTEQFLRDRLIETEIRRRININDADVLEFYREEYELMPSRGESFEVAMILRLPAPSEDTDNEARERIMAIQNRIIRGESFEDMAREFSECPSSQAGGNLGSFGRGMMVEEFEEVAFQLDVNEVSDIVKTEFGYHLIKVTEKNNNEVSARHILITVSESPDDVEREREFISELAERIKGGESFGDIATIYSHDDNSRDNNGVVNILTREQFPSFFASVLNELSVGEMSDVFEYQNMFYLFRINESFPERRFEFEEIREQLRELLTARRQSELYEQWVQGLQNEIYVHVYEERLDAFR